MIGRACVVCGADITDRRSEATTCGDACRRELNRTRRLLRGEADSDYQNLADWLNRRRIRAGRGRRGKG
jgi:hypothetical protein